MAQTLADALNRLDSGEFPYSEANAKKIRGSANKCAKLPGYNCPLSMIPADVDLFVRKWAKNMQNRDAPDGFATYAQFQAWHSNVKSLMDHASGEQAKRVELRKMSDTWTDLMAAAQALVRGRGHGIGFHTGDLVPLSVLQSIAREDQLQPCDITSEVLLRWMAALPDSGRKHALRRAARTLDRLRDMPEFTAHNLLPARLGPLPRVTAQRRTPPLPGTVLDAIADYQTELATGQRYPGLASAFRRRGATEATVKSIRDQLSWYFSGLVELGHLDVENSPDVADLTTQPLIQAVFEAEFSGAFPWKTLGIRTLEKNMGAVWRFARRYHPDLKEVQAEFSRQHIFDRTSGMTKTNEDFCVRLMDSPARIRTFLHLAASLHDEARALFESYDSLTAGQKSFAHRRATAAAAAAVLTFLPLRCGTLLKLDAYGEDAHILFPTARRDINVAIPAELMKNRKPMTATFAKRGNVDPRAILEWWLKVARPRVITTLRCPDPLKLMAGISTNYLAEAWKSATADRGIYMTLHQVRHAIASILLNQPGADLDCIAAMLNDSPATVARAYAFFDRQRAFERGQQGLSDVNSALTRGGKKTQ